MNQFCTAKVDFHKLNNRNLDSFTRVQLPFCCRSGRTTYPPARRVLSPPILKLTLRWGKELAAEQGGGLARGMGVWMLDVPQARRDKFSAMRRNHRWVATIKTGHLRKVENVLFYKNVLYVQ